TVSDRTRLASEHEEGGLEGVVGVVAAAHDAAANGQDHRPVAADQRGEGRLIASGNEVGQQPRVGPGHVVGEHRRPTEVADHASTGAGRHVARLREATPVSADTGTKWAGASVNFCEFISLHTPTAGCNELMTSCNELALGCNELDF